MCRVLGSFIIYPRTWDPAREKPPTKAVRAMPSNSFSSSGAIAKSSSLIKTDGIQSMVSRDGSFSESFFGEWNIVVQTRKKCKLSTFKIN